MGLRAYGLRVAYQLGGLGEPKTKAAAKRTQRNNRKGQVVIAIQIVKYTAGYRPCGHTQHNDQ